jgi:outer membrane lipoprotein SlyB
MSPAAMTAAPPPSSTAYAVEYGVVRDVALVDTGSSSGSTIGAGTVIGGVLGAVIGNQVGSGFGRAAATGAGAVGGALVGNQIEGRRGTTEQAYRVDVQTDRGDMRSFYYRDLNGVRVGDRVRIENNQLFRN